MSSRKSKLTGTSPKQKGLILQARILQASVQITSSNQGYTAYIHLGFLAEEG